MWRTINKPKREDSYFHDARDRGRRGCFCRTHGVFSRKRDDSIHAVKHGGGQEVYGWSKSRLICDFCIREQQYGKLSFHTWNRKSSTREETGEFRTSSMEIQISNGNSRVPGTHGMNEIGAHARVKLIIASFRVRSVWNNFAEDLIPFSLIFMLFMNIVNCCFSKETKSGQLQSREDIIATFYFLVRY